MKRIFLVICLGASIGVCLPAQARNAQGAFIVNHNNADPTAHNYQVQKRYQLTDSFVEKRGCSCGNRLVIQRFNDGRSAVVGSGSSRQ